MTTDEIIDGILEREGSGEPPYLTTGDRGGRTSWGISEKYHSHAWLNGPPTRDAARIIYLQEYVHPFDFVKDDALRVQLVDCAVLHGRSRAYDFVRRALGVDTITAAIQEINKYGADYNVELNRRMLNNAVVAYRLQFIDTLTDTKWTQKKFEEGWESRALSFLV